MTIKAVEAVFFARYTISNFRAVYGRLSPKVSATYTKDFFQVLQAAGEVLAEVLNASKDTPAKIEYTWPNGSCEGTFDWDGSTRWRMKWLTRGKPLPWTIGSTKNPEISIPGNPELTDPSLADAEYSEIEASGTEPWLIAVKLFGDSSRLHVRTYFRNPTAQFSDRSLDLLPTLVRDAIDALPISEGSGAVRLPPIAQIGAPPPAPRAVKLVTEIQEALKREPNVLLVGPPGTGKSVALEDLQALYESRNPPGTVLFDSSVWGKAWSVASGESRSETLVFHPSYSYENFVAGLYPKAENGAITLEATAGPLLCLSHWVGRTDRRALLIIDEFNRGPAAAIFGDCLSLLDKDKRSTQTRTGAHITRPYFTQQMPVPASYCSDPTVAENFADEIRLPAGVHIVAAMNSTDRSVAPLDAAMRRRFTVIRVRPDYEALAEHLLQDPARANQLLPTAGVIALWTVDEVSVLAVRVLQALNERIEYCLGEDFLLGHALVWSLDADTSTGRLAQLANAVDSKIVPTLRMTFVDQDDVLAAVLGVSDDQQVSPSQAAPSGTVAYWKAAPASLASFAEKRLVVQSLHKMETSEQLAALAALSGI